jgi:hypothetical protein
MILMFSGFEAGNREELGPVGTGFTIQTTTKRTGAYALKLNPVTTGLGYVQINSPGADGSLTGGFGTDCRVQFYLYVAALPTANSEPLCGFSTASVFTLYCGLRSDGKLELFGPTYATSLGVSTTVLSVDTWYLIDLKKTYTGADWDYELRIFDAATGTGGSEVSGNTDTLSGTSVGNIGLGKCENKNGKGYEIYIDDLAISSGAYIAHPFQVEAQLPSADGTYTSWSGDYTAIDEVPFGTDYQSSSTLNAKDSAVCGGFSNTDTILSVKANHAAVRGISSALLQCFIRSNTTEVATTAVTLGGTIACYAQLFQTNPDTLGAWALAALNALELGVICAAARASRWHNAQIHALFGYIPPVTGGRVMIAYNFGG